MARLADSVYAAHHENLRRLASKEGGVSRPQIIELLNVTRVVANTMIKKCNLRLDRLDGRTEFFVLPSATNGSGSNGNGTHVEAPLTTAALKAVHEGLKQARAGEFVEAPEIPPLAETDVLPPAVLAATIVEPSVLDRPADLPETDDKTIASLDAQIDKMRVNLRSESALVGKAMGEMAIHQALVESARERLQELVSMRLELSPI